MCFLLLGVCRCRSHLGESMRCNSLSIWNSWWKWKILLSPWWFMFLCTWYILRPHMCVSFYHSLSSVWTRWRWREKLAVVFVYRVNCDVTDRSWSTCHGLIRYGTHSCQERHKTDVKYDTHSCHVRSYVNDRSRNIPIQGTNVSRTRLCRIVCD